MPLILTGKVHSTGNDVILLSDVAFMVAKYISDVSYNNRGLSLK